MWYSGKVCACHTQGPGFELQGRKNLKDLKKERKSKTPRGGSKRFTQHTPAAPDHSKILCVFQIATKYQTDANAKYFQPLQLPVLQTLSTQQPSVSQGNRSTGSGGENNFPDPSSVPVTWAQCPTRLIAVHWYPRQIPGLNQQL